MAEQALVNALTAQRAVIARHIDAVYLSPTSAPTPQDYILDFDGLIESATDGFVGRDDVFAQLEVFRAQHPLGYFEIISDAGLGKTTLAAEIARRRRAVAFFASASRGLKRPDQFLTHVCGELITRYELDYDHLPARAGEDATFLDRVLREAVAKGHGAPVWIVVDALDEADDPPAEANPLLLPPALPPAVYIVVTRRTGRRLLTHPGTWTDQYVIRRDAPEQDSDIEAYLRSQAAGNAGVARALAEAKPPASLETFVAQLKTASDGNFMYVRYMLADIAAHKPGAALANLNNLPKGLQGYYEQFWSRMQAMKAEGWADWVGLYRSVIERLGVAAEAVTVDWLAAQVGRDPDEVRERALEPWERLLSRERRNGTETWRLVHRSFGEFLAEKVNLRDAHVAVADHYAEHLRTKWPKWDDYGLRHTATHYAEAARKSDQPDRHLLVERLVFLVTDLEFQKSHLDRLLDPTLLERDLELALRSTAEDGEKPAILLVAEVALPLVSFRRQQSKASPIFELAKRGQVQAAERRLDLFALDVDPDWYNALLLTVAWLAAQSSPRQARVLRDRIRSRPPASPTLALVLDWVNAALDGTAGPSVTLPPPPSPQVAAAIVERLSGSGYQYSLLGGLGPELLHGRGEMMAGGGYLAAQDGPLLVAFAAADPQRGEPLLRRYVDFHAAYGYRQYRTGSLWALLDAVLRHPVQEWVRTWVPLLGAAALAPNRGDFQEGLEIAALALRVLADAPGALEALEARRSEALAQAGSLPVSDVRGQGDAWGTHKRRLAALAEAFARLPGRAADATELVGRALELRFGFAGFHAPAYLTLAEAVQVASPNKTATIDQALDAARASAHNIQDATFCARTTARVNAMRERWWGTPPVGAPNVSQVVEHLCQDASAAEFATLHVVGETYERREPDRTIPLPPGLLEANNLTTLSEVYQRPLSDFLRLNAEREWGADQPLPPGARVNVPDPGFPPLLAACLAAQALANSLVTDTDNTAVVRSLVPVAARDVTALGTVLARLVLASDIQDTQALERLQQVAASSAAEVSSDLVP